ncbi:MAG: Flp family type IVb pilin [Endozoicomonas sp.]
MKFMQVAKDFLKEEEGLTAIEYAVGAAIIVAAFGAFAKWVAPGIQQAGVEIANELPVAPEE